MDKGKPATACSHKLARLIDMLVTKSESYVDQEEDLKI